MADIVISAAQTLMIFTAKQLFVAVFTPEKASVIKIVPILHFEDAKRTKVTLKSIRIWQFLIMFTMAVVVTAAVIGGRDHFYKLGVLNKATYIGMLILTLIIACLLIVSNMKALYIANG